MSVGAEIVPESASKNCPPLMEIVTILHTMWKEVFVLPERKGMTLVSMESGVAVHTHYNGFAESQSYRYN